MNAFLTRAKTFLKSEDGPTATEYAVVAGPAAGALRLEVVVPERIHLARRPAVGRLRLPAGRPVQRRRSHCPHRDHVGRLG